jgi:hypothetical protein
LLEHESRKGLIAIRDGFIVEKCFGIWDATPLILCKLIAFFCEIILKIASSAKQNRTRVIRFAARVSPSNRNACDRKPIIHGVVLGKLLAGDLVQEIHRMLDAVPHAAANFTVELPFDALHDVVCHVIVRVHGKPFEASNQSKPIDNS